MSKILCAIAGVTGIVGQTFLRLLHNHPYFEVASICASDRRAGQKLGDSLSFVNTPLPRDILGMPLEAMDAESMKKKGISVVFSALPADTALSFETQAASVGMAVFSNASAHRMDLDVPILIPEINPDHLQLVNSQKKKSRGNGFIITNANCTATGLCLALAPLADLGIHDLVIASYQALSGAGHPGHSALEMSANCIPFIAGEEEKLVAETNKIFGTLENGSIKSAEWRIYPHCVRVPSQIGHLISVHAAVQREVEYGEVAARFRDFEPNEKVLGLPTAPVSPIILLDEQNRPQPRLDVEAGEPERARGMAASIGRLTVAGSVIRFFTLSNNLVRGAAGGSVLNAELAFREGLL